MMAGIVWQVVTLLIFGGLCTSYALRIRSHRHELPARATTLLNERRFKMFLAAMLLAYLCIFARCVYRIAEMANGWGNSIMQDEAGFIALEGAMIAIATVLLTVFHPGLAFPEMQQHKVKGWSGVTEQEKEMSETVSPE